MEEEKAPFQGELESLNFLFHCPLTKKEIIDPYICQDGWTYEKEAIENWLKTNNTSPMTNKQMKPIMVPNRLAKLIIDNDRNAKLLSTLNTTISILLLASDNYLTACVKSLATLFCDHKHKLRQLVADSDFQNLFTPRLFSILLAFLKKHKESLESIQVLQIFKFFWKNRIESVIGSLKDLDFDSIFLDFANTCETYKFGHPFLNFLRCFIKNNAFLADSTLQSIINTLISKDSKNAIFGTYEWIKFFETSLKKSTRENISKIKRLPQLFEELAHEIIMYSATYLKLINDPKFDQDCYLKPQIKVLLKALSIQIFLLTQPIALFENIDHKQREIVNRQINVLFQVCQLGQYEPVYESIKCLALLRKKLPMNENQTDKFYSIVGKLVFHSDVEVANIAINIPQML